MFLTTLGGREGRQTRLGRKLSTTDSYFPQCMCGDRCLALRLMLGFPDCGTDDYGGGMGGGFEDQYGESMKSQDRDGGGGGRGGTGGGFSGGGEGGSRSKGPDLKGDSKELPHLTCFASSPFPVFPDFYI